MVVNTAMMRKVGLSVDKDGIPSPVKSWDELAEYAKKLTVGKLPEPEIYGLEVDVSRWDCTLTYMNSLQATRGSIFGADGSTVDISSKEAIAFLKFCQDGVREGWASNGTVADSNHGRTNFKARLIAMIYEPLSRCNECRAAMGVGPEEVQVMPIPGQEKNGGLLGAHHTYVPKLSKVPELAKQFIKEQLLSVESQQWSAINYGKYPVMRGAYKTMPPDAQYEYVLKFMEKSVKSPNYVDFSRFNDLVMTQIQTMMVLKQSVEETTQNIKEGYKDLDLTIVK
jgi:ABC-type glycerol-3-phosphate transport system substrate-binding protein